VKRSKAAGDMKVRIEALERRRVIEITDALATRSIIAFLDNPPTTQTETTATDVDTPDGELRVEIAVRREWVIDLRPFEWLGLHEWVRSNQVPQNDGFFRLN
jgi:hypothetical protein